MTVIGLDENDAEELVEGGRWKGRGKGREVASMDPMVEASSVLTCACTIVSFWQANNKVGERGNVEPVIVLY